MNHMEVKRRQIQALSYMIGVAAFIILGRSTGDNGIAYLAVSVEAFSLFLLLICTSVPEALGRMLRSRNTKGQYKNAALVRKSSMLFQVIMGLAGGGLLFLLSDMLEAKVLMVPYTAFLMKLLSPVLVFRAITGVLEGYFQGTGSQMPTVAVSVLRQIFWLGFGLLFGNIMKNYGSKVGELLRNENMTSMYGTIGLVIAMIFTELLLLLFLLLIYMGSGRKMSKRSDGLKLTEGFGSSIGTLYGSMSLPILLSLLFRLPVWLGIVMYGKNSTDGSFVTQYGIYYGKYLTVCALAAFLFWAGVLPLCSQTAGSFRREEHRFAGQLLVSAVHICLVNTLFAAVFMAVLAPQLSQLLFTGDTVLAAELIRAGSFLVVFGVIGAFLLRLMLLTGRQLWALGAAGIFCIIFVVVLVICLKAFKLGIAGLVYAGLAASGIMCVGAGFLMFRQMKARPGLVSCLAVPGAAAGAIGLLCMLLGNALTPHLGPAVTLLVSLLFSLALYWAILLFLRSFREQELGLIPGGRLIRAFAQMLRVIRR